MTGGGNGLGMRLVWTYVTGKLIFCDIDLHVCCTFNWSTKWLPGIKCTCTSSMLHKTAYTNCYYNIMLDSQGGQDKFHVHVIKLNQYSTQEYTRSMWKQQNTNSSSAEVCRGALGHSCSTDFLPDAKHLSGVESLHLLIFSVRLHGHVHNCLVQAHSRVQRISNSFIVFSQRILLRMH